MDAYKLWVRKNRDLVCSLESLANWVTWILPEQFGNSEVGAEAVYALLGIVSCVNKHIIETPADGQEQSSSIPWALVLSILRDAEAAVEVAAQHFVGDDRKWGFLAVTEALKACVRLAAFRESGYRMLLQGGEVENEEQEEEKEDILHGVQINGVPVINPLNGYPHNGDEIGSNGKPGFESTIPDGRAVAAIAPSKFGQNVKNVSDPMWMQAAVMEDVERQSVWSWKGPLLFMFGEAVNIFRPLVYVLMVSKLGIRSWTPWLVSLAVELASIVTQSHATHLNHTSSEREEFKRRKMMCALHVMRDPFFTNYTWHHLKRAEEVLNPLPLIFLGKLIYMAEGLHSRYTYTSGS